MKHHAKSGAVYTDLLPGAEVWQNLRCKNSRSRRSLSSVYDSFINSQRWLEIRRPIIARANGYCEHCRRKTARLDVHHLTYVRFGGDELPRDLEALCEDCHPEADQSRRAAIAALREYKRELRAYEGFMHWKYGEGWHRDPYAYSLASFQEFEETTRQWDDEAERDYGHYQDYDEE